MANIFSSSDITGLYLNEIEDIFFNVNGKEVRYNISDNLNYLKCIFDNRKVQNDKIFEMLNISNKHEFCRRHYGYEPKSGNWPEAKLGDFEALIRLIKALYARIELGDSVYTPFKEGDWVVADNYGLCEISRRISYNRRYHVVKVSDTKICHIDDSGEAGWFHVENYRHALPSEIPHEQLILDPSCKYDYAILNSSGGGNSYQVLENSNHFKSNNNSNGNSENKTIWQTTKTAKIQTGERITGCLISGKGRRATISFGHLSYREVTGY